ncbi:MAG TPA: ABC transporter substrate-binding protein, partial [Frankiaceae bacterium]|nr:ABC transporter substrate-binding protein [Frankiaceae bacterium]
MSRGRGRVPARSPHPAVPRRAFHHRLRALAAGLGSALLVATGCGGPPDRPPLPPRPSPSPSPSATAVGKPGGTLRIAGTGDASGDPGWADTDAQRLLVRMVSRQLYSYPAADPNPRRPVTPTPDLADGPPQVGDGGRTWTVRLRPTVRWDVPASRRVTATDVARGLKRLCTPPRPAPLRGYFAATITGFTAYCTDLARTRPAAARAYVEGRSIPGVQVVGDDTVVFRLLRPANDFTSILALPAASPVPLEALADPPDSPAYRSHLVSDGPYRFSDPKPGETARLSRNPVWDPGSDPLRRAYVDHVTLRLGLSAAAVQEQLERGQADMSWDTAVPAGRVPALHAGRDPRLSLTGPPALVVLAYGLRGPAAGALRSAAVRQALTWCVDKRALLPAFGGADLARPSGQLLLPGTDG